MAKKERFESSESWVSCDRVPLWYGRIGIWQKIGIVIWDTARKMIHDSDIGAAFIVDGQSFDPPSIFTLLKIGPLAGSRISLLSA